MQSKISPCALQTHKQLSTSICHSAPLRSQKHLHFPDLLFLPLIIAIPCYTCVCVCCSQSFMTRRVSSIV
uniref:Uncharacterized protein n=1 Tax=Arundo donax TaxID=35708 RepID=A0A0A8ZQA3_ARUDO